VNTFPIACVTGDAIFGCKDQRSSLRGHIIMQRATSTTV